MQFQQDDPMYLSILIPDLAPENALENGLLPTLEVLDPMGEVSTYEPTERVALVAVGVVALVVARVLKGRKLQ